MEYLWSNEICITFTWQRYSLPKAKDILEDLSNKELNLVFLHQIPKQSIVNSLWEKKKTWMGLVKNDWDPKEYYWSGLRKNISYVRSTLVKEYLMSSYFCPHLMFNFRHLIEFVCLKSDLIDNSNN